MGSPVAFHTQGDGQEVAGAVAHAMPCADMVSLRYAALGLSQEVTEDTGQGLHPAHVITLVLGPAHGMRIS